jgi:hypothetical protein
MSSGNKNFSLKTKYKNRKQTQLHFQSSPGLFESLPLNPSVLRLFYKSINFDQLLVFLATSKSIANLFCKHATLCKNSGFRLEFVIANKDLTLGPWIKFFENVKLEVLEAKCIRHLLAAKYSNVRINKNFKELDPRIDHRLSLARFSGQATITELLLPPFLDATKSRNVSYDGATLTFEKVTLSADIINSFHNLGGLVLDQVKLTTNKTIALKPITLNEIRLAGGTVENVTDFLAKVKSRVTHLSRIGMAAKIFNLVFTSTTETLTLWDCFVLGKPELLSENLYDAALKSANVLTDLTLVDARQEKHISTQLLQRLHLIPNLTKLKVSIGIQYDIDCVIKCENLQNLHLQSLSTNIGATYRLDKLPSKLSSLTILDLDLEAEPRTLTLDVLYLQLMRTAPTSIETEFESTVFFGSILRSIRSVSEIYLLAHKTYTLTANIMFDPIFHLCSRIHMSSKIKIVVDEWLVELIGQLKTFNSQDAARLDYETRITKIALLPKNKVKFKNLGWLNKIAK